MFYYDKQLRSNQGKEFVEIASCANISKVKLSHFERVLRLIRKSLSFSKKQKIVLALFIPDYNAQGAGVLATITTGKYSIIKSLVMIALYQVDAFTDKIFGGNPAAVCPLKEWLPSQTMQAIARENNLSETAFFVINDREIELRWFTPTTEVNLCGHATLAVAHVVYNHLNYQGTNLRFLTKSGILSVSKTVDLLTLDFPALPPRQCDCSPLITEALGRNPLEVWQSEDYLVLFEDEKTIGEIKPNMELLKELDRRGVIVTAKADRDDFVSRFFAPKLGIPEDPVTGSAHCTLIPYWSQKLGKTKFVARQISSRGGTILGELKDDRALLSGRAVTYLQGLIEI
jgi:PhzF family phenazine biosynthesis protein